MCGTNDKNAVGDDADRQRDADVPRREIRCHAAPALDLDVLPPPDYVNALIADLPLPARLSVRVRENMTNVVAAQVRIVKGMTNYQVPTDNNGLADFGNIDAGDWDVTVTLDATHNNNSRYVPRGTVRVQLAPMVHEEIVQVDATVRVPLGIGRALLQNTWVRFYLPQAVGSGGPAEGQCMWISVACNAGRLVYHGNAPTNAVITTFAPGGDDWDWIPAGAGGWRFCRLLDADADVTITLHESGFAREAAAFDSNAVIPWNFYFWSNCRRMGATGVAFLDRNDPLNTRHCDPFQRFDAQFAGAGAFAWESDPAHTTHNDLAMPHPGNPKTWEGHCNWMGAASVIFERPQNSAPFTLEDLKLYAAEFAANNLDAAHIWNLEETTNAFVHANAINVANLYYANDFPVYPLERLRVGARRGGGPAPGWWNARLVTERQLVGPVLGNAAATFFSHVREQIGTRGRMLLCDLRQSYTLVMTTQQEHAKAAEIWNQAVFYYEAVFREHPDSDVHATDERQAQDLAVDFRIWANSDGVLPTDHMPGTYAHGSLAVNNGSSWSRRYTMRLQFANGGQLIVNDPHNRWENATNLAGNAFYFLPRYLDRVTAIRAAPRDGGGNPACTRARVTAAGLVLRALNA
jgi:hypothetical protein